MYNFLSERVSSMAESATLAMHSLTQLLRAQGHNICDLSLGEPNFSTPYTIQQAAKQAIDSGKYFSYAPVAGYKDLREAIAKKLNTENKIDCKVEHIVVSNGVKQALSNLFLCLLNPGDEVIVYAPYWVTYASLIQLAGGKPIFIKGDKTQNYVPTIQQLEQAITSKTKAIIFSSPSNPTGAVLSKKYLLDMADIVEKHKHVLVIADEIYEYISFTEDSMSIGSIAKIQDRVITLNGFSKGFAMPGWRVGYLAGPTWIAKACEKMQGQLTSANCSIAQRAALAAFDVEPEIIAEMRDSYKRRRDVTIECLKKIPHITYSTPLGAFYMFPDISYYFGHTDGKSIINNSDDLCMYLLQEAKVSVVSGTGFGDPKCIRISYATSEEIIKEGMSQIQAALQRLYPTT